MNYQKIYNDLIAKRIANPLGNKNKGHRHHIKPKRLFPDLATDPDNIVKLTYREHFIAHLLYAKICLQKFGENSLEYKLMHHVVYRMCCTKRFSYKITGRLYQQIKEVHAKIGPWNKGRHDLPPSWIAGKHHTLETRNKISAKCKNAKMPESMKQKTKLRMIGNKICVGRKRHDYELKHFSESMKGRIRINNGINNKFIKLEQLQEFLDAGWKIGGKPLSKETKQKLSAANKGKIPANKGKHYKHSAKK